MIKLDGYVVMDVETTITPFMKRKASPFTPENWVVAGAYKGQKTDVKGEYWGDDKRGSEGWLKALLETYRPRYMVGFNIKFDVMHMIKYPMDFEAYREWIVAGGQLWDTQLVEYLLDGQIPESQMLALDEVAPRYGGEMKIDEVKAMWEQGINTNLIPRQLLMDYLTGRIENGKRHGGDILNTETIFLGQLKAAKKVGQIKSIQLNNGALVASIEMERNGLYVNRTLGEQLAKKSQERLTSLTESLLTYLPKDLPFTFNWGSPAQRSALIFGGQVKYKGRVSIMDADGEQAYSMMDAEAWVMENGTLSRVEDPSNPPDGVARFTGGMKKGLPKTKKIKVPDLDKPKSRIEDLFYRMKGFTKPKPEWKGKSGYYSTKGEIIEELAYTGIPFLEAYAELAAIQKDLGTYYITHELDEDGEPVPGKSKGMLTLVQDDSIIHHKVNHTNTVTGRLSHSDPNAGNLPKHSTSEVKRMFESRFQQTAIAKAVGGVIITSDFKTLEVYCQANLSHDKQLVQDLREGIDVHSARLATVEGMPYEDVLLLTKGDKARGIAPVEEWEVKRTDIKVFSFQRAYGAGAEKISRFVKKSKETVQSWIDADELRYPGITRYNEKVEAIVKSNRWLVPIYKIHPNAKVKLQMGRGWYRTFDGKKYVFTESPSPKFLLDRGIYQGFTPTELKNYPVQGLGGEWMKAAMWLAVRIFYAYKNFDGLALLINTVHDALYADAHESVRLKAAVAVHAAMLAASDLIEYLFGYKIDVPVPSETSEGPSMYEQKRIDDTPQFTAAAERTRKWLRKTYMEGFEPSFI